MEIIVNGGIVRTVKATNQKTNLDSHENQLDERIPINGTSWIAARCFEDRPDKRIRFAHSSPVHVDIPGKPLRPRQEEIAFLIRRVKEQLARNETVLPKEGLDEYHTALAVYENFTKTRK